MQVNQVSGASAPQGTGVVAAPVGLASLLPLAGEDGLMALFALRSADRTNNLKSATKESATNQELRKQALENLRKALRAAAKARKKGGFWNKFASIATKVAKLAAVAGAVAAVVASGGAAAPVVALALSSGAFLQGETKVLQKLGMSDEAANWTEVGMSLGGGGIAGASQMSLGQGIAMTAQGVSQGAAGVATIKQGEAMAEHQHKLADAESSKGEAARMSRMQQVLLQALKHEDEASERVLDSIRGSLTETQRTHEACIYRRI